MQISKDDDRATHCRSYTVKISAREIAQTLAQASEAAMRDTGRAPPAIRMPGFRPGKIPANLARKMHGPAIEHDALNQVVQEGVQELLADFRQRPGATSGKGEVRRDDGRDVEIRVALEVLPEVPEPNLADLELRRLIVEISDEDVAAEIERLAHEDQSANPKTQSGRGRGAGQDRQRSEALAREKLERELATLSRTFLKRQLFDHLEETNRFPVSPSMVEAEFDQIWAQLQQEAKDEADAEAALSELERERDEYRAIAERRVRLGLLLSEIGVRNGIKVTEQEMSQLIHDAAQKYSGKDRVRFVDHVRSDMMVAAQLRAPLFEDKVVDWLLSKATITDQVVDRGVLEQAVEADDPTAFLTQADFAAPAAAPDTVEQRSSTSLVEDGQALNAQARHDLLRRAAEVGPNPASHRAEIERQARQVAFEILGSAAGLGRTIDTDEDLVEAINSGFPPDAITFLREAGWPPRVLESVIAPKRTLMRRKSDGQRLSPSESDAAWRLAYILGLASTVLNGRKAAMAWLSRPKSALHRHLPHELLRSSVGTNLIASLLRRLDEGNLA